MGGSWGHLGWVAATAGAWHGRPSWARPLGEGGAAHEGRLTRGGLGPFVALIYLAPESDWFAHLCCACQPSQSPYETDLLHPLPSVEAQKHKLKRLVQTPNSFFMDVKCPGCFHMYFPSLIEL